MRSSFSRSRRSLKTRPKSYKSRYLNPPWINLLDLLVVPAERSSFSKRPTDMPRRLASLAMPVPTIPPPTIRTSNMVFLALSSSSRADAIIIQIVSQTSVASICKSSSTDVFACGIFTRHRKVFTSPGSAISRPKRLSDRRPAD